MIRSLPTLRLESERLELIAATPDSLRAELASPLELAALLEVAPPEVWPAPLNSVETVRYTLDFLEGGPDRAGWMTWYFVRKQGRVLVGVGGFAGRPVNGAAEVGYSLLEAHQKRGYATEAVGRLIEHAFSIEGIGAVTAQTLPSLAPSIRLLERLGFRFAGPGADEGAIRYTLARP
jgi:[ribosomal protein S5]-alanine N-acetyltransferase